jgi:glucose-1-phosphate thymidylyltransferase
MKEGQISAPTEELIGEPSEELIGEPSEELVGLIPAAGKGLRLRLPYPKELYPIIRDNRYKPISQFVVENLTAAPADHIVFVINERKHQLVGYFGDGHRFGCSISYVVQEVREDASRSTSPGLGHALDAAYHLTRGKTVLFGMADTIMEPVDLFARMLDSAGPEDDVIMGLFPTDRPHKFGMTAFDEDGHIPYIIDKPQETDLTHMWGCIIWRSRFTEHLHTCISGGEVADFALIMNMAIEDGMRFRAVCFDEGAYLDLGTYDEIIEMEQHFRAK